MISKGKNTVAGTKTVPAVNANAVAVLQRTKQKDGSYIISLPVNTSDEVITNFQTGETLTDRLINLNNRSMGILQDLSTLILKLSPILGSDLKLNNIYREDFSTDENIIIQRGEYRAGAIYGTEETGIVFHLKDGIVLSNKPILVSIKDTKNIEVDINNVDVLITANGQDSSPTWFDCTDHYLQGLDVTIPVDYEKEEGKPWCINVKFQFKGCEDMSVTDVIIAHM